MIVENSHDNPLMLPPPGAPDQVRIAEIGAMRVVSFPPEHRALAFVELVLAYRRNLADEFPHGAKPLLDESARRYGDAVLTTLERLILTDDGTVGRA